MADLIGIKRQISHFSVSLEGCFDSGLLVIAKQSGDKDFASLFNDMIPVSQFNFVYSFIDGRCIEFAQNFISFFFGCECEDTFTGLFIMYLKSESFSKFSECLEILLHKFIYTLI